MFITKLKMIGSYVLVLTALTVGGGFVANASLPETTPDLPEVVAEAPTPAPQEVVGEQQRPQRPKDTALLTGKLDGVDASSNSVTITTVKRGEAPTAKTYTLAKVLRDGKDAKLADLKKGGQATLKLDGDQKLVVSLNVTTPTVMAPLKSVDADKNTITVSVGARPKEDKTYAVAKDAKIMIDGQESKLSDLKAGSMLQILINDADTVTQIRTGTRKERKVDE